MPELLLAAIKFITDNPWRAATLFLLFVCCGAALTIRLFAFRAEQAVTARERLEAQIIVMKAAATVQDGRLQIATEELTKLRKKQIEDAKKIKEMFDNYPDDCDGAASASLKILRGGK